MITDLLFQNGDFALDTAGNLKLITGTQVIGQDLEARLQCAPGDHFAFPEAGVDLRQYLLEGIDPIALLELRQEVEIEAMKDPRVYDLTVTVTQEDLRSVRVALDVEMTDETLEELGLTLLIGGET